MYICICKSVTDSQLRHAVVEKGIASMRHLSRELGVCSQCGKCAVDAKQILESCRSCKSSISDSMSVDYRPAMQH